MADAVSAKKILVELSKREDLNNKVCSDCSNPNPQWASLSFAIFICLQCAGAHRGFGVHVSFVRSISMDTWQNEQVGRMQLGGNLPFKDFMRSYEPADQGGYKEGLSSYDTYHCWAATQYREKLDAILAERPWSPSLPPANLNQTSGSGSPAFTSQGLRKSRTSTRAFGGHSLSNSPNSLASSPRGTPNLSNLSSDTKTANEGYFSTLGQANSIRSADLPPSQGGRYQGFGNSPTATTSSSRNPALGTSSAAAPTFSELHENPIAALGKGWSLFSAAVAGATRAVSENIIQPGIEKVSDSTFQASVRGYMTEAQKKAALVGDTANQWSKNQFGVDVADSIGGVVETVKEKVGGGPARAGYGSVPTTNFGYQEETSGLYSNDEDFFEEHGRAHLEPQHVNIFGNTRTDMLQDSAPAMKKKDWEDEEWKDF